MTTVFLQVDEKLMDHCCNNSITGVDWTFFSSVQFSRSGVFDSATAHQASLSITKSQSLLKLMSVSQWCHGTISSSVVPFSSCLQSFPASESFQMSQLFHIRWPKYWSFSFSISPSNDYKTPLEWTGWISLQSKGLSRVFSNTTVQKHQFFGT